MYPSVKTIETGLRIDREKAKRIRAAIDGTELECGKTKLECVNDLLGGYGVEFIEHGHNEKSPYICYVNMGDTYSPTVMKINAMNFRIGCWGDIVERGDYD